MKLSRSAAFLLLAALAALSRSSVAADNVLVPSEEPGTGNVLAETDEPDTRNVLVPTEEPGEAVNVLVSDPSIESPLPACALIKCSDEGGGVCGSDGVTYANACQLKAAQCRRPDLTQADDVPCESSPQPPVRNGCPELCPRLYLPVCDASGTVYGSPCEFLQARCKDSSLEVAECPKDACALPHCAPIEKPVCASNGKTYMNRCLFSYFACKHPELRVEHDGDCEAHSGGGADGGDGGVEAPTGCAAMLCREFSECRVDEAGRGYCADTCDAKVCGEGETCKLKSVQCFTTPCPPVAECVKANA